MTVLVSGASGFIGTELVAGLRAEGHRVNRLVRRAPRSADERQWAPDELSVPQSAIDEADAIVNLSGASLSRLPWTHAYKRTILMSRVRATTTLAEAIARSATPPSVFVSGSAVGFYGDRPGENLTEGSEQGTGFLPRVVESWEAAAAKAVPHTRVVFPRTGLVVGDGGALTPLMMLAKLGLAGPLGTGHQYWPWISLHDEAAAIRYLITSSTLGGAVNLAGPHPASAGDIAHSLAAQLKRPYWLPAPSWAIKAALADAGSELLLADQRVIPERLLADGFTFRDVTADQAIAAALSR